MAHAVSSSIRGCCRQLCEDQRHVHVWLHWSAASHVIAHWRGSQTSPQVFVVLFLSCVTSSIIWAGWWGTEWQLRPINSVSAESLTNKERKWALWAMILLCWQAWMYERKPVLFLFFFSYLFIFFKLWSRWKKSTRTAHISLSSAEFPEEEKKYIKLTLCLEAVNILLHSFQLVHNPSLWMDGPGWVVDKETAWHQC